jgi:hypothetical protein
MFIRLLAHKIFKIRHLSTEREKEKSLLMPAMAHGTNFPRDFPSNPLHMMIFLSFIFGIQYMKTFGLILLRRAYPFRFLCAT